MLYKEGEVNCSRNPHIRAYSYGLILLRFLLAIHNLARLLRGGFSWRHPWSSSTSYSIDLQCLPPGVRKPSQFISIHYDDQDVVLFENWIIIRSDPHQFSRHALTGTLDVLLMWITGCKTIWLNSLYDIEKHIYCLFALASGLKRTHKKELLTWSGTEWCWMFRKYQDTLLGTVHYL